MLYLRCFRPGVTLFFMALIAFNSSTAQAATSKDGIWADVAARDIQVVGKRQIVPVLFRTLRLNSDVLASNLLAAPMERSGQVGAELSLPMPGGGFQRFRIEESPVMETSLAARYPEIKTYLGTGIDDPGASVRLDRTPAGFHAMILSSKGTVYVDPYQAGSDEEYLSYFKRDYVKTDGEPLQCRFSEVNDSTELSGGFSPALSLASGSQLRTYRLAVAATGEYTAFHGGTVVGGLAAIVTTINRVTGIYETETAIRLVLVANNDQLIYTNSVTDPYTNSDGVAMLSENQSNVDAVIGNTNYDVGHVFSTGGGGVASLGVICSSSAKGRGVTGLGSPVGDPFDVDFVAHEMGHQFGGNHTFNGSSGNCAGGNRNASTAYEPGSGTTIQAYAGICSPQNLQSNSDAYFHGASYDEITAHVTSGSGSTCPVLTSTGNSAPIPNAGSAYTLPISTPFTLTGSATDPEGDPMTFGWEEFDLGPTGEPNSPSGDAPVFRTFTPTANPSRTFPRWSDILNNTQTLGELLPTYSRSMNFRLTVRDNQPAGGGVDSAAVVVTVTDTAGPFLVTAPNTAVSWTGANQETVTWDVANTNLAPVSCSNVDVLLSTDSGATFPTTLLAATANDGSEPVTAPNTATTTARVMVVCSDNVFFDVSDTEFTINAATIPDYSLDVSPNSLTVCAPDDGVYATNLTSILSFSDPVTLSTSGVPVGATATFNSNPVVPSGSSQLTISNTAAATPGSYSIDVQGVASGINHNEIVQLELLGGVPAQPSLSSPVNGSVDQSLVPLLSWGSVLESDDYVVEIASDATFTTLVETATVSGTSHTSTGLASGTTYYWRVSSSNTCGTGSNSAVFSFTTTMMLCRSPNAAIPDGSSSVSDDMVVANNGTLTDMDMSIKATHTYTGDLTFTLTHVDTGTSVIIIDRPGVPASSFGCSGDNYDVTLDDEVANPVEAECAAGTPTINGTFTPNNALSVFDNESLTGTWRITATDAASQDSGTLTEWCLLPTLAPPDDDNDGIPNSSDNCPNMANPTQLDTDGNGEGNACDSDDDGDGLSDEDEINIHNTNSLLADTDGDGFEDGEEITAGSDPLNIASTPLTVGAVMAPAMNLLAFMFLVFAYLGVGCVYLRRN